MSSKSYVNARLREAVRYKAKMLAPYVKGQKALDTARAWLDRDYSGVASGFCMMADDVTLPVYWHTPDGQGGHQLVRGQCLIVIDFRTLCILGFSLQPDANYNQFVIHTLFTRVFTDWHVPRVLYFERGIWQRSSLLTGGPKAIRVPPDWQALPLSREECSRGFGDLGCRFIHAYRARSKPVERVIGLVQDRMEGEPGYCGRDERRDCPETTKRQMDDVKARRAEPWDYFYSQEQWHTRLCEIFTAYNHAPQEGKMLDGLSPIAAQQQFQDAARAPINFDLCRHLLGHYRVPVTVGSMSADDDRSNGITIRLSGREYIYRDENTGRDKFKSKLAWFNPEEPSILAVTDCNMRNPYSVPISRSVSPLAQFGTAADVETYQEELGKIAAHESYARTLYHTMKAKFAPMSRRMLPDRATVETGAQMAEQREIIQAEQRATQSRVNKSRRIANRLELPAGSVDSADPDAAEGLAMMEAAKRAQQTAADKTL